MKRPISLGAIALVFGLSACADGTQAKLRQTVYDMSSAYHVAANPMPDVMAGKVPGITLTEDQKSLAKRASQTVVNELSALEQAIVNGNSLTQTAVSAVQADIASFTACWSGLKTNPAITPASCNAIGANK